jgi:hypothetical protein
MSRPSRGPWLWVALVLSVLCVLLILFGFVNQIDPFGKTASEAWRNWRWRPLLGSAGWPLLAMPAVVLLSWLRQVSATIKASVVMVAAVATAVSVGLGLRECWTRAHFSSHLVAAAARVPVPAGLVAAGRPALIKGQANSNPGDGKVPEALQYWTLSTGNSQPCAAVTAAFAQRPGWSFEPNSCSAYARFDGVSVEVRAWTGADIKEFAGWNTVPSQPGGTVLVSPDDGEPPY